MSKRLSTSATFQAIEGRVRVLEQVSALPATLENNTYLSAQKQDGTPTRVLGINTSDTLYFGGIDATLNSVVITNKDYSAIELNSLGVSVFGALSIANSLQAPTILVSNGDGKGGDVRISGSGVSGYTGIVEFHKLDGTRNGFVGFNPEAGAMQYASDTGAGHNFQGGPITLDDANIGIKKVGADPVYMCDANDYFYFSRSTNQFIFTIGGANKASIDSGGVMSVTELALDGQFYHVTTSGNPTINFDSGGDALIYNRSANTYQFDIGGSSACNITATGLTANGLSAPTISVDANFYLGIVSSQPRILWDATDSLQYDRTANALTAYIGGSTKIVIDTNGLTAAGYMACGTYIQIGDVNFFAQLVSGNPQITFDSGDNITFERTLNKFLFLVGGVVVASIDASGNMRLKGTLTQSVTP